jgi:GNAT superfamily N-acetyltransferase
VKIETLEQLPLEWIEDTILKEKSSWTENGAANILSFLKSHAEEFTAIGLYEEGLIGVLVYRPQDLRIILIGIAKEKRRHGYGTALLDGMKEKAEQMHFARIEANAASNALAFYRANGFAETGEPSEAGELSFTPVEYLLGREMLGKTVTIIIDHPYGSFHPTIADAVYPVNFGYVSGSECMQDAWAIGPQEPVETFTGIVAGIVYHRHGASRWIVIPPSMVIDHQKIIDLIGFEEQYYETEILWSDSH